MTAGDLETSIREIFGIEILRADISFGDLTLIVSGVSIPHIVLYMRDSPDLKFDMLLDIATVDNLKRWPEGVDADEYDEDRRFEVIYIFNSTVHNHRIRLKVYLPEDMPTLPTITEIFQSANWAEREAFDMMGIQFERHPNLKRILTHYKFEGHPLRKDYPVNKEQWLDEVEPLTDELLMRLEELGIAVAFEDI